MVDPANVDEIITQLEEHHGQPEVIITELATELRKLKSPRDGPIKLLVPFSQKLNMLVANIKALGKEAYLNNPMEVQQLVSKLPTSLQIKWIEQQSYSETEPNLGDFNEFVKRQAKVIALLPNTNAPGKPDNKERTHVHYEEEGDREEKAQPTDRENEPASKSKCGCCQKGNHKTVDCRQFLDMTVNKRWKKIKANKLCLSCLTSQRHSSKNCPESKVCAINGCTYKHHKLLHSEPKEKTATPTGTSSETAKPATVSATNKTPTSESVNSTVQRTKSSSKYLKYVPVTLYGRKTQIKTYALLDDGSTVTLLDHETARKLGINGEVDSLCIKLARGGRANEDDSMRISLKIAGQGCAESYALKDVRTVRDLDLNPQTQDAKALRSTYPHLSDVPIPDLKNAIPLILIGTEHSDLLLPKEVRKGRDNEPAALLTKLGWTVLGKNKDKNSSESVQRVMTICECSEPREKLDVLMKQFFTLEDLGVKASSSHPDSIENERAKRIIRDTMKKVNSHKYEIGLFWKKDDVQLSSSYAMALRRLEGVEHRMKKDPDFGNWYQQTIQDYLAKGYLRETNPDDFKSDSKRVWYLPHFCVTNFNKQPPKRRLVFDAAARNANGDSLNKALIKGPDEMASLLGVLFKFRQFQVAVAADVREMFSQVSIKAEDQQSQRVLWRNGDATKQPKVYIMQVMTFGSTCSPSSAQAVKNYNAEQFEQQYPIASKAIKERMYVDDYLDSFPTVQEAVTIANQVIMINDHAGFTLRNFCSNSKETLRELPNSHVKAVSVDLSMGDSASIEKVLGLQWFIDSDEFGYRVDAKMLQSKSSPPTKRQALRLIMKLFDPMGFIAHLIAQGKTLMQDMWKIGIDWDDPITAQLHESWEVWLRQVRDISSIRVQRCYFKDNPNNGNVELHVFVDASDKAYAAVAYFRLNRTDAPPEIAFVSSKSRVASTSMISIPRLELLAALLGSRLATTIVNEHTIDIAKRVFWSDSKVVLGWIRSTTKRFKTFVGTRKSEINDLTKINEWRYIPTKLNVADIATKNRGNSQTIRDQWFSGPEFLKQPEKEWPSERQVEVEHEQVEEVAYHISMVRNYKFDAVQVDKYSSWPRLVRTVAYVYRFIDLYIKKSAKFPSYVTTIELKRAENYLLRKAQYEAFQDEFINLENGKSACPSSPIFTLSPVMDADGVIRMASRLQNAKSAYETKNPAILPRNSPITTLIVRYFHAKYLHFGHDSVINALRQKYWIIRIKAVVKSVKNSCQRCKNHRAKPQAPLMGQLPACRVQRAQKPFTATGVDLFGPILVTVNRHHEKRYGVIFVCMATRAIHIELANSLSSDAFIVCLKNFIFRRGPIVDVYSDNGTNFVGAYRELNEEWSRMSKEIAGMAASLEITWHFNPPAAPHFGGAWESLIKIVKTCLTDILKSCFPKEDTLRAALIEAEHIVNSRPLTHIPLDCEDDEPLTPNHFLIGCAGNAPTVLTSACVTDRRQWKLVSHISNRFWDKWIKDYLPTIARRSKWQQATPNLKPGDIGLIVDENAPRNTWKKAKILEVHPGSDKVVRTLTLKTDSGQLKRPATRFAKLDIEPNAEK